MAAGVGLVLGRALIRSRSIITLQRGRTSSAHPIGRPCRPISTAVMASKGTDSIIGQKERIGRRFVSWNLHIRCIARASCHFTEFKLGGCPFAGREVVNTEKAPGAVGPYSQACISPQAPCLHACMVQCCNVYGRAG